MNNILYLAAGSNDWGLGHLKRSKEIIDLMRLNGWPVHSLALVPGQDERHHLAQFLQGYSNVILSLEEIKKYPVSGLVIDLPTALQKAFASMAGCLNYPVVAVDWYETDKGISQKINLRGGVSGLKFAIIRSEILNQMKHPSPEAKKYDCVVLLGGRDRKGYAQQVLKLFREDARFSGKRMAVILGPLDQDVPKILKNGDLKGIDVYHNPDNLPEIMANSKIGISNAGTSLMELTALGVPTIVLSQSKEEEDFGQTFFLEGCSVPGSLEADVFFRQLEELWSQKEIWLKRSHNARRLIDGRGAQRIVEVIGKILQN